MAMKPFRVALTADFFGPDGQPFDRVLGVIGLGGIGRALIKLLEGFGMRQPLAYDPFVTAETACDLGVRTVGLDELMSTADFVSIHCPLTNQTRNLIGARELGLMK